MRYTTFDMEYADVILPSICSITIIDWEDNTPISIYSQKINPDCEIEERMANRHKLTNEELKEKPILEELWKEIYNHLENKLVFSHKANRNFTALKKLLDIDYLYLPPLIFCCTESISKKVWPYLKDFSLPNVTERLGIDRAHFHSEEDAKSVNDILQQALKDTDSKTIAELFKKIGFSGGYVIDNEKHIYRAVKQENIYTAKIKDEDDNVYFLEWDGIEENNNVKQSLEQIFYRKEKNF